MVTSKNLRRDTKRPAVDNNKSPKRATKVTKKIAPKKAFFAVPKPQTPVSSQDISQLSFAILVGQTLSVTTPSKKPSKEQSEFFCLRAQPLNKVESFELESHSPISLWQRRKIVFLN